MSHAQSTMDAYAPRDTVRGPDETYTPDAPDKPYWCGAPCGRRHDDQYGMAVCRSEGCGATTGWAVGIRQATGERVTVRVYPPAWRGTELEAAFGYGA